ncbi:hypothetical protein [Tateyamaria sp. SN3-11]|uniref:hypothetical protein n=1 Tax=Tateyamaria sp. SN3-11 TaxID=3092147 RepID=UPI0039ED5DDD
MLSTVYGDSLDYSAVRVRDGGSRNDSGFTPFNTINIGRNIYREDFSQTNSLALQGFFVHESAHALQTQNGRIALLNGIGPQITAVLVGRREVYDYNDKLNGSVPFEDWNIEEQASFFEDLYKQQVATANDTPLTFDPFGNRVIPSLETLQSVDTSVYIDQVVSTGSILAPASSLRPVARPDDQCFLHDSTVQMWPLDPSIKPRPDGSYDEDLVQSNVWYKRQDQMQVGDVVVSYDKLGRLQPGDVTRTMTNIATHILDFWGTGVTPGHAYNCADGPLKGSFAPIMDILRMDGALMRIGGTMFRAATNCDVGSIGDRMIHAEANMQNPDGSWTPKKRGQIRFGTRISTPDGKKSISVMEIAERQGWGLSDDGYMVGKIEGADGTIQEGKFPFPYTDGAELPKPEDYILTRSQVTLGEIYLANEWEQIGTRMPAPDSMASFNPNSAMKRTKPKPNIPPAFADRTDAPRVKNRAQHPAHAAASPSAPGMNRKQRKAIEAGARELTKRKVIL